MDIKLEDDDDDIKQGFLSSCHSFNVNGSTFVVDSSYVPINPLGHGAYGIVCSARDQCNGSMVAIKKIPNAFNDVVDAKRLLREVKLMRHFNHENIVRLRDIIPPLKETEFNDIYFVLDFMETDLHRIIYSTNELTDTHIKFFIYQILRGLKYIHSANVIHRDLKPSNILVNGSCDLKICDFGLARGVKEQVDYELTEYVVTRYYRAPEIMCCCQQYDSKIDVWSLGCILAELHGRKPLFPGEDYLEQMTLMFETLGSPSENDLKFISNKSALEYITSLPHREKIPFTEMYKNGSSLAMDLLEKMLVFDPEKRITVTEALSHPYFADFHDENGEPSCKECFSFEFENEKLSKDRLKELMWEEIFHYRKDIESYLTTTSSTSTNGDNDDDNINDDDISIRADEGQDDIRKKRKSVDIQ